MSFNGHRLGLGEARLLDGNSVKDDSGDRDALDGWVYEDVSRNAVGAEGRSSDGDDAGSAGSAGGERYVKVSGAGNTVGREREDGSVAGGIGDGGVDIGAGGTLY
jgi:hypothetical protein